MKFGRIEHLIDNPTPFRHERKFIITEFDRHAVESIIKHHPGCFSQIYHERRVNSIYLDSGDMHSYLESELGAAERSKIRIRWYGELFTLIEKPMLEIKVKKGYLGKKIIYPLASFSLDADFSSDTVKNIAEHSLMPPRLKEELILMHPTLLISYLRKYFQSSDGRYRLSLDWNIRYYTLDSGRNTFKNSIEDLSTVIVEIKYDDRYDETVYRVTDYFPFRFSRNSKYTSGVENLFYFR